MRWSPDSQLGIVDVTHGRRRRSGALLGASLALADAAVDVAAASYRLVGVPAAAAHRLVVGVLRRRVQLVADDRRGRRVDAVRAVDDGVDDDRGGRRALLFAVVVVAGHLHGARPSTAAARHHHLDRLTSSRGRRHLVRSGADGAERAPVQEDHEHARHVE